MKTLSLSVLSVLFASASFGQTNTQYNNQSAQTVKLVFNTNGNKAYQVVLDGTSYYSNYSDNSSYNNVSANTNATYSGNMVTISNLAAGQHTLQVYRLRNNSNNNNNTYNNPNKTNGRALYSSTFTLRRNYAVDISIANNGAVSISQKQVANNRMYNRRNNNGNYGTNSGSYNNGNINRIAMTESDFNSLLKTVRGKWFQSSKITSEKDAFNNSANYFTTSQVRQLLQLISTESNKLDLAKLAYSRVIDPANFTQLYDMFNSQSSKDELDTYARQYRY